MSSLKMRAAVLVLLVAAAVAALGLQACGGNAPSKPDPQQMPVT